MKLIDFVEKVKNNKDMKCYVYIWEDYLQIKVYEGPMDGRAPTQSYKFNDIDIENAIKKIQT